MRLLALLPLVAVAVLGLSAASGAPSDPWIGKWKSIDLDGSNQTLTITKRADGAYDVILFDDRATLCGGIAADGKGIGTVTGNLIAGTTTITCADGRVAGTFPFKGTYNSKTDTFTDGLGVVWSRVRQPAPPKTKPVTTALPLGRLVLTARETPGLKRRAARPAQAKEVLANALHPTKLPGFAPKKTQVARFERGKTELWSIAFVMKNPKAARTAARSIAKAVAKRDLRGLAVWSRGSVLAAVVLRATWRGSVRARIAHDYARVADARIARAFAQTAWTRTLGRVSSRGRVSRKNALALFALAYGPLPGTRRPTRPVGPVADGTSAGRRILRVWRKLTPAQRAAARRLLGVTSVSLRRSRSSASRAAPATAGVLGDPNFAPNPELQSQAEFFAKVFAAKLNYTLKLTIVAGGTTTPPEKSAAADAYPVDKDGALSDDATVCRIRLTTAGQKESVKYRNLTIAHEVFHCFEFEIAGPIKALDDPDWIIEGMADWAAMSVYPVPFNSEFAEPLIDYFQSCRSTPLFARAYDASGFFGHFDDSIGSFWSRVVTTLSQVGSEAAYEEAGGEEEAFLDTWAPSIVVQTGLGPAWYAQSPLAPIQGVGCIELPTFGEQLTLSAAEYTLWPYRLEGSGASDRPLLHIRAQGHARLADGAVDTSELRDAWFCVNGECRCPSGTEGFPPPAPRLVLPAHLALTGHTNGATASLQYVSLDQYCTLKQAPPPAPCPLPNRSLQSVDACPRGGHSPPGPGETFDPKEDSPDPVQCYGHGCARSVADPHLSPFDGPWYDFQGVGEFTLLKSTTDDLEIQVRQQPWPGSKTVAANVAVAMRVAGDRVGIYRGEPLVVRINRRPVLLGKKDLKLPGGGTIKPLREGQVDLVWPDGSTVRVVPTGDLSTDVIVSLVPSRQGKVRGLLGNDDLKWNPDDDFTTRGGRRLDPKIVGGTGKRAYHLLYKVFGESWRVSQKSSLFDYAPGQSTRTFTDRRFPARIATPEQIDRRVRKKAEAICRRMRIQSPRVFRNCVLDVSSTGFFSFAVSASTAERSVRKARKAPKPPPPKSQGATVRWAGKTYTYRNGNALDGCLLTKEKNFEVQFSRPVTTKNGFDYFKVFVQNAKKDGTYTQGAFVLFVVNKLPIEIADIQVKLAGNRTRGTFSGVDSTPAKQPVTGSFQC